ncbi:PLDc N-terminal domain-containing protein [Nocardioides astragali]|uniref:PLDc N-terminal domain-containing protein n=1 Tax=Nocardioides astragali TaxID=1776736 RepID=A0ABW2MZJ9_9ACTN|nr:PLDc N-terminal domain-containing protein [Nocardioides astragali]
MAKKSWAEMTPTQKKVVIAAGIVEVAVTTWCLRDLKQRPDSLVRGPKLLWGPAMSVQPFGPIAYLVWGRKR